MNGNQLPTPPAKLARRIGLPLLTFYGLGTILGAGIYVLVGKVAAQAGLLAPMAFLLAAAVATMTALSYCQLVIHYPKSAGEAYYVQKSFKLPPLSITVGYLVIFTGIVSAATLANGFAGYLSTFVNLARVDSIILVVMLMGLIAIWGIAESLWLAAIITLVELSGLLLVLYVAGDSLAGLPDRWPSLLVPTSGMEWAAVFSGAFLAFYAFIGFEDMVNVVEEVKQPARHMPAAILLALFLSGILYLLIALVAILGLPLEQLSASQAPLRALLEIRSPTAGRWIGIISLFAIINGVITQIIMASRVLYGMADQQHAPAAFSRVSTLTQTPWLATITVVLLTLAFALWLPLLALAKITSFVILVIFTLINLALWRLLQRGDLKQDQRWPCWPRLGAALCLCLLGVQVYNLMS